MPKKKDALVLYAHMCGDPSCRCTNAFPRLHTPPDDGAAVPPDEWHTTAMEMVEMALKKPSSATPIKPMPNAWKSDTDKSDYPFIYEFLTATKYETGEPRITGSISFFTQLGVLKASISDKDNNRVTYVEAPSWSELIAAIDMAIADENTVWRQSAAARTPPY